jgi:hypothetical protein
MQVSYLPYGEVRVIERVILPYKPNIKTLLVKD